jgi:hypothetical protein
VVVQSDLFRGASALVFVVRVYTFGGPSGKAVKVAQCLVDSEEDDKRLAVEPDRE